MSRGKMTSRLQKNNNLSSPKKNVDEGKRLWRQVIILIILGCTIGLTFMFVVFPILVKVTGIANSRKNVIVENRPNPQPPILTVTQTDTSEPNLEITGFAEPDGTLQIINNGDLALETTVDSQGNFRANLELSDGANEIEAYVTDAGGLESAVSLNYLVNLDTQDPVLIFEPEPPAEVIGKNNRNLQLTGQTEIGSKIYVNERMGKIDSEGKFTLDIYLNEGTNDLHIEVLDAAGNSIATDLGVNFKP